MTTNYIAKASKPTNNDSFLSFSQSNEEIHEEEESKILNESELHESLLQEGKYNALPVVK
jgi:hypothetical protein